jgi:hypothetical protein
VDRRNDEVRERPAAPDHTSNRRFDIWLTSHNPAPLGAKRNRLFHPIRTGRYPRRPTGHPGAQRADFRRLLTTMLVGTAVTIGSFLALLAILHSVVG